GALDPANLANPDKLFPVAGASTTGLPFLKPPSPPRSEQARHLVEKVRSAPKDAPLRVRGASTRLTLPTPDAAVELLTTGMNRIV
ncbi:hypothetical protein ABTF26_20780, partial [Acinetobacter baumannii]